MPKFDLSLCYILILPLSDRQTRAFDLTCFNLLFSEVQVLRME